MRDPPNTKNYNVNEVKYLEIMGVQEMDAMEMSETDGGLIGIIILAACCLMITSCTVNVTVGDNNTITGTTSADSTGNGNTAGNGSGNF